MSQIAANITSQAATDMHASPISQFVGPSAFAIGIDAPFSSRKASGRGRTSIGGSKIPHRPTSGEGTGAAAVPPPPVVPANSTVGHDATIEAHTAPVASIDAYPAGRTGITAPELQSQGSAPAADVPGAGAAAARMPIFAVGAADGPAVGFGTPRSARGRPGRYKPHPATPPGLTAPSPIAAPSPFSLLESMSPFDGNQKSWPFPMDTASPAFLSPLFPAQTATGLTQEQDKEPQGPAALQPVAPAAKALPTGGGPAGAATTTSAPTASGLRFPIYIQIPGAREVQDMFSSVSVSGAAPTTRPSDMPAAATSVVPPASLQSSSTGFGSAAGWQFPGPAGFLAGKKPSEAGSHGREGGPESRAPAGNQAGNDCQPTKDNPAKASRVCVESNTFAMGDAATNGSANAQSAAPAPTRLAVPRLKLVTPTAAASDSAAGDSSGGDAPYSLADDVLLAVAEQLEQAARLARAARADPKTALNGESSTAVKSVLEELLRPGAVDKNQAANSAAMAALGASLLEALKLGEARASARGPSPGHQTGASGLEAGGSSNVGTSDRAPPPPVPAAFGGFGRGMTSHGKGPPEQGAVNGGASSSQPVAPTYGAEQCPPATPIAAATGPSVSVPFVFGSASKNETAAAAAAPRFGSSGGGSATVLPFTAGTSSPPAQPATSFPPAPPVPSFNVAVQQPAGAVASSYPGSPTASCGPTAASQAGVLFASTTASQPAPTLGTSKVRKTGPAFGAASQLAAGFGGTSGPQPAPSFVGATTSQPAPSFGGPTTSQPIFSAPAPMFASPAIQKPLPSFGAQSAQPPAPLFGAAAAAPQPAPSFGTAPQRAPSFGTAPQPAPSFGPVPTAPTTSVSMASASESQGSPGVSPMSTTPVSGQQQASQAATWGHALNGNSSSQGGEQLKFSVGLNGGHERAGIAAGPAAGVTPGRVGGRVRPKLTPRKSRAASHADGSTAQRSSGGGHGPTAAAFSTGPAAPKAAPAGGEGAADRAAAPAAASHPAASASGTDNGVDAAALQALRIKRTADEKKLYGNQKYEQGDFRAAERWYSEAIDVLEKQLPALPLSPERQQQLFPQLKTEIAVLHSNRSGARMMTQKPVSALEDALRAMSLDPKFMRAATRAATCYCRLGDFGAAHRVIDAAMDRCSAASTHYQDMLKKLNEVVELGARTRAATAAAVAAAASGSREKVQTAVEQLAGLREQVAFCDVVAAARAVLALRLGSYAEAMTLVSPHPEVPQADRAAPWRLWIMIQARYLKGDLQEALASCQELKASLQAVSPGGATAHEPPVPEGAAAAAFNTAAHVTVPSPVMLEELAGHIQQLLKHKEEGNTHIKAGRHSEAAESYSKALSMGCCPTFAAVLHGNRAAAYQAQSLLADAVADCGRSRALDKSYYRASTRLAALMLDIRRPENAQGLLEPLLKPSAQSGGSGPGSEELTKIKEQLSEARAAVAWQKTPNHYRLLGLANTCSEEDVRKAYRRLALKHHPDKAMATVRVTMTLPGTAGTAPYSWSLTGLTDLEGRVRDEASWLFNFLNQANEELSDKSRRRKVDQLLDAEQPPAAPVRYGNGLSNSTANMYSNMFRGFYPGMDPFVRATGAAAAGSRPRSGTGGGASGSGTYGSSGTYGPYTARQAGTRPSSAAAGGSGSGSNSARNSHGAGSTRGGAGAAGGGYGGAGSGYTRGTSSGYPRAAAGGGGGRKWWEPELDSSDQDEQETFNF